MMEFFTFQAGDKELAMVKTMVSEEMVDYDGFVDYVWKSHDRELLALHGYVDRTRIKASFINDYPFPLDASARPVMLRGPSTGSVHLLDGPQAGESVRLEERGTRSVTIPMTVGRYLEYKIERVYSLRFGVFLGEY